MGDTINGQTIALPPQLADKLALAQQAWRLRENTQRLWSKDASLWTGRDEGAWLGWLDIAGDELRDAAQLRDFGQELRESGFSDVLLLGMGGSSWTRSVGQSLGSAPGYPKLHVLDSTDPDQVRRFESGIDVARTAFIVSSKSGTTLEPNVLMDYFFARVSDAVGDAAGRNFVAVTDPGSQLQKTAEDSGFRHVFFGVPSIGGRFSVLSKFGLVPLAASGHDVRTFLELAAAMAKACGPKTPPAENPGVSLGLTIGVLALNGRDKLTVLASPPIAAFGAWIEQLVAEVRLARRDAALFLSPTNHPATFRPTAPTGCSCISATKGNRIPHRTKPPMRWSAAGTRSYVSAFIRRRLLPRNFSASR